MSSLMIDVFWEIVGSWGLGGKGTLVLRMTLEFGFRVGRFPGALVLLRCEVRLEGWDIHVGRGHRLRFYDDEF